MPSIFSGWHKHEVKYDTLIIDVQKYLDTYFADLKSTTDRLQPLTLDTCQQANPELTARAAFSMNVRTFVLVKDKKHSVHLRPVRWTFHSMN